MLSKFKCQKAKAQYSLSCKSITTRNIFQYETPQENCGEACQKLLDQKHCKLSNFHEGTILGHLDLGIVNIQPGCDRIGQLLNSRKQ